MSSNVVKPNTDYMVRKLRKTLKVGDTVEIKRPSTGYTPDHGAVFQPGTLGVVGAVRVVCVRNSPKGSPSRWPYDEFVCVDVEVTEPAGPHHASEMLSYTGTPLVITAPYRVRTAVPYDAIRLVEAS